VKIQSACETTWLVTITREDGDNWPDTEKQYSKQVIRPALVEISFYQRADGNLARVNEIYVKGPRVLADGRSGQTIFNRYYCVRDLPGWARELVSKAAGTAGLEVKL
jgi:hypothetical protein